ncbi:MAG: hypothetical protein A3C36_00560 [Omnitrophica WOR_2 bacterium RIFCSPHIGHO2_02_FULL_52_10]|nr:MAG: hypothetical protein A3C36_00560 [Omnitrophica WOR_2 bacterium RIFCSPHIGHO2_02_FULL_52_10]
MRGRKKISASLLTALLMLSVVTASAQVTTQRNKVGQKEPFLARLADWFATVGKPQEEKYLIQKNRRAARKLKKAKKDIARKKKQAAKQKKTYTSGQ